MKTLMKESEAWRRAARVVKVGITPLLYLAPEVVTSGQPAFDQLAFDMNRRLRMMEDPNEDALYYTLTLDDCRMICLWLALDAESEGR